MRCVFACIIDFVSLFYYFFCSFHMLQHMMTVCICKGNRPSNLGALVRPPTELQIIFTVVSVFTKENFNPFSNLISPFGIGTHEIQWLFSIFLTHNWSPIYLLL